ncbi:uncharacterized protein LOC133300566 [Gastrolobium bilobum]|uniref:uncharacterized protein LOC133300566 n=1 Tax=Gastrolobium bilobum TaxID=150636 RepID=UPI002AB209D3|nr:uncharacterized protein LOC133300566 [Gastrolobium bilobum]
MPKIRRVQSPSIDCSRSYPYPSSSQNVERHKPMNLLGSVDEMKEWEDARCPICMEPPHNAVLLKCSSHEIGCRSYMCNTSYRHSNCLDQFCKSFASHLSSAVLQEIPLTSTSSSSREFQSEPRYPSECGSQRQPKLICPLCRGEIYGYMVLEPARSYMNSKSRNCSSETCEFQGTYPELRKHARSEHPYVRPSEVDPSRRSDWLRMEQERDLEDLVSSIHARSGSEYNRDIILAGGLAGLMSLFLFEIFSSIQDVNRMATLSFNSRHRVPLHDLRSGTMQWVSNDTQTNQSARWRSNLPSAHQTERSSGGRRGNNLSSSLDLEANRTARWRTNLSSSRIPRDVHQYYTEIRTSSTRASQVTQTNSQSNIPSSGRIPGHQLRWRDQRWSTHYNQDGNRFL